MACEFHAVHARHRKVGDDELPVFGLRLECRERRVRGAVGADLVAEALQRPPGHAEHLRLVVREQDALGVRGHARLRVRREHAPDGGAGHYREIDAEGRACIGLAVHHDDAVERLDDPFHHREAEAGALALLLRREKRIENPLQRLVVHARAVVLHAEADRAPSRDFGACLVAAEDFTRGNHDAPAGWTHRLRGVRAEVHEDALHFRPVRAHEWQGIRDVGHKFDGGRCAGTQELQRFVKRGRDVERHGIGAPLPAVAEDLDDELPRSFAGGEDRVEHGAEVFVFSVREPRELRIAEDGREDVVEVVRDSAREAPDHLGALGLLQLGFQPRAFLVLRELELLLCELPPECKPRDECDREHDCRDLEHAEPLRLPVKRHHAEGDGIVRLDGVPVGADAADEEAVGAGRDVVETDHTLCAGGIPAVVHSLHLVLDLAELRLGQRRDRAADRRVPRACRDRNVPAVLRRHVDQFPLGTDFLDDRGHLVFR